MITLGYHSYNPKEDIDCYEGINLTIGKYCSIGSGLKVYSGNHPPIGHPEVVSSYPFHEQFGWNYPNGKNDGFVTIENDVWIATDVRILEGVTIGDGVIVGAGTLVTKDIPPYTFVAGNPAQVKYYRFPPDIIIKLLQIKWWDWDDEKIKESMPYMKDVMRFVEKYT